jgi:hypothetical protein
MDTQMHAYFLEKTMMEGKTYTLKAGKVAHDAGIGP